MSETAIKVENLSKVYRIGSRPGEHDTFREALAGFFSSRFRRLTGKGLLKNGEDTIWALKDVSFEVKEGEVLGIIGRNGAGKSTLLKILSRITEPTSGRVVLNGRVASLLEVGTGFHPELTGRENIFLNGAILGMTREEIRAKFDEIVAFSELERFIDTPVKRYSSGMYLRLAFAVAAHLQPEILLVDEVLAVGDAAFQKKCLGKMGDIARGGRTVLFVSHNMSAMDRLCKKVILLDAGKNEYEGAPRDTIQRYLLNPENITGFWKAQNGDIDNPPPVSLVEACASTETNKTACSVVAYNEPFKLIATYRVRQRIRTWALVFRLIDSSGNVILDSSDADGQFHADRWQEPRTYRAICAIPGQLLRPGVYAVTIITHIPNVRIMEFHENIFSFEVSSTGYPFGAKRTGIIAPTLKWTTEIT